MPTATRKPSKRYPGHSIPDAVRRVCCCPVCGTPLLRTETGWVCRIGLDHTGIKEDWLMRFDIEQALPDKDNDNLTRTNLRTPDGTASETNRQRRVRRMLSLLKRLSRKLQIPRPLSCPNAVPETGSQSTPDVPRTTPCRE